MSAIRIGYRRLSEGAQRALAAAAALGGRVTAAEVGSRGDGMPQGDLDAALDELEWQRWLAADGQGYVFVAGIVERVIERDMLTPGQRRRFRDKGPPLMDNLCHTLVGAALAQTGLKRRIPPRHGHPPHRRQPAGRRRHQPGMGEHRRARDSAAAGPTACWRFHSGRSCWPARWCSSTGSARNGARGSGRSCGSAALGVVEPPVARPAQHVRRALVDAVLEPGTTATRCSSWTCGSGWCSRWVSWSACGRAAGQPRMARAGRAALGRGVDLRRRNVPARTARHVPGALRGRRHRRPGGPRPGVSVAGDAVRPRRGRGRG